MREAAKASAVKSRRALQPTSRNLATAKKTNTTSGAEKDEPEIAVKEEHTSPPKSAKPTRKRASPRSDSIDKPAKKTKLEDADSFQSLSKASKPSTKKERDPADLQLKKLKAYTQFANQSPFPDFIHPTGEEAKLAHRILSDLHGARTRPKEVVASTTRAGCGDSPSVLDALVRTILSQNTSDTNSTRAKLSMDQVYGRSDKWDAIVDGGQDKLQEAIKCGGLSVVKSKVIISILRQVHQKYGTYSLDHLHDASSEDAMSEMLSFQGVGPKTASCVLLFCLKRESFAVDTHVWRLSGLLGWRPKDASRDETHAHLDVRIPDDDKYGLHILMVTHGKRCDECKAGGKNLGNCELRRAFRKGKVEGMVGEEIKVEEIEKVEAEGGSAKGNQTEQVKEPKKTKTKAKRRP